MRRGDVEDDRLTAPFLGHQFLLGQLLTHACRIGVLAVGLGDRDDDRHVGRARVRDRLDRLRHHAVVGGDHEDRDVGHLRAPRSHRGERLVTRRVDERDAAIAPVHLVGTDGLGDAPRFTGHDVRVADAVQQRRLAVVDVAHDGDDRRARLEQRLVFFLVVGGEERLELDLLFAARFDEQHLRAERLRDQLDHLVRERSRRGDHLPRFEQQPHEVGGRAVQLGGELLDRDAARDDDLAFGDGRVRRGESLRRRFELFAVATPLLAPPLRGSTGPAAPAGAAAETTGAATGTTATATATRCAGARTTRAAAEATRTAGPAAGTTGARCAEATAGSTTAATRPTPRAGTTR